MPEIKDKPESSKHYRRVGTEVQYQDIKGKWHFKQKATSPKNAERALRLLRGLAHGWTPNPKYAKKRRKTKRALVEGMLGIDVARDITVLTALFEFNEAMIDHLSEGLALFEQGSEQTVVLTKVMQLKKDNKQILFTLRKVLSR